MERFLAIDIALPPAGISWAGGKTGKSAWRRSTGFPNGVTEDRGHLVWDVEALEHHVRTGIERAKAAYPDLVSLSIDTWGVDYVLLRGEEPVLPVYAYRDSRTESVIPEVHKIVPFSELYRHTGCQFQPFNSIYQIYADKKAAAWMGSRTC